MEHVYTRRNDRYKYSNSGGNLPLMEYDYNESDECQCFCSQCKDQRGPPKPCCKEVCFNCEEMQDQKQGQTGIVFVPYPFPLMVPNLIRNETTSTTSTTTTSTTTTTTTEKPTTTRMFAIRRSMLRHNSYSSRERYGDIRRSSQNMNYDSRYMQSSIRKMKPTWEPRYGIIPIPDNLAENLMSQLREVKELQARY